MDACFQIAESGLIANSNLFIFTYQMEYKQLKESLAQNDPPAGLSIYLQALWYDGKNDWQRSHAIIQDIEDPKAAWIHAYLHRKEGDIGNADYWYRRAGRKRPVMTLQEEWEDLVNNLAS
jgi:hypothetical protein